MPPKNINNIHQNTPKSVEMDGKVTLVIMFETNSKTFQICILKTQFKLFQMSTLFEMLDKENPTWIRSCLGPCAFNRKTTPQDVQFLM